MSTRCAIVDNLVIGGGLAGSMVAMRLSASGRRVTLLEKERSAHHKVCGEFLSGEAVEYLLQAGIDPLSLGAAAIHAVRLCSKQRVVEAALPFSALSLSRRRLDEAMITRAAELGCEVKRGALVERLTAQGNIWLAETHRDESFLAQTVFLANGKHDLRGWHRAHSRQGDLIGFKLHWLLAPSQVRSLRGFIELFLFPGGYGGLSLVENEVANLCLVVRRAKWCSAAGWIALLASILDENRLLRRRMQGAKALWERPLAISSIPYGYLDGRASGLWCVGDQAAVIPSFTGDGMSIALHSAALAAQTYLAGESTDLYYRRLHRQLCTGMSLATWLSRAMVSGAGRAFAPFCLSVFPGAMRWIAASTRVPEQALVANPAIPSPARLDGT